VGANYLQKFLVINSNQCASGNPEICIMDNRNRTRLELCFFISSISLSIAYFRMFDLILWNLTWSGTDDGDWAYAYVLYTFQSCFKTEKLSLCFHLIITKPHRCRVYTTEAVESSIGFDCCWSTATAKMTHFHFSVRETFTSSAKLSLWFSCPDSNPNLKFQSLGFWQKWDPIGVGYAVWENIV